MLAPTPLFRPSTALDSQIQFDFDGKALTSGSFSFFVPKGTSLKKTNIFAPGVQVDTFKGSIDLDFAGKSVRLPVDYTASHFCIDSKEILPLPSAPIDLYYGVLPFGPSTESLNIPALLVEWQNEGHYYSHLLIDANANGHFNDDPSIAWRAGDEDSGREGEFEIAYGNRHYTFRSYRDPQRDPNMLLYYANYALKADIHGTRVFIYEIGNGDFTYPRDLRIQDFAAPPAMLQDLVANIRSQMVGETLDVILEKLKKDTADRPDLWEALDSYVTDMRIQIMPSVFLDRNGDQRIQESESQFVSTPFRIANQSYQIQSISGRGDQILIRESAVEGPEEEVKHMPQAGEKAPAMQGEIFAGSVGSKKAGAVVSLAEDFKGKIVLVDFWGTWCGPCKAAFPMLAGFKEKWGTAHFDILGIISRESTDTRPEAIQQTLVNLKSTWSHIWDQRGTLNQDWHIDNGYPASFIVDGDTGIVLAAGEELLSPEVLEGKLAHFIAEKSAQLSPPPIMK